MQKLESMGRFTAIGVRTPVSDKNALIISTVSGNDTADPGDLTHWTWCNPTNRIITHYYEDIEAVSVESLWQGTKLLPGQAEPDHDILQGNWRKNKGKRPAGAYAGPRAPLITDPGEARRRIYIPSYRRLIEYWLNTDLVVVNFVQAARKHKGPVFLRDFDTGRGVDTNRPMSHSWVLCVWLNTGEWPQH
jgi:hypothetical protein